MVENKLKYAKFFGEFNGRKVDSTMLNFTTLGTYMKQFGFMTRYVPTTTSSLDLSLPSLIQVAI